MTYIISDIHGCYNEYLELLQKIRFNEDDLLYVLGDVVDRGPDSMKVLQDMMKRPNVVMLLGNHDCINLYVIGQIIADKYDDLDEDLRSDWVWNGGLSTFKEFVVLSEQEQDAVLNYLSEALVYTEIENNGKKYLLSHAGIQNYVSGKALEEYALSDFIEGRMDYSQRYLADVIMISGHTPTALIRADKQPLIYEGNGHIAIDCGCVYGGQLAAYCLETGKAVYAPYQGEKI